MQAKAVKALLAHRLDGRSSAAAKAEWHDIVEGDHALWQGVSQAYKATIRSFLVHFHTQLLRHTTKRFDFCHGSVGACRHPETQGIRLLARAVAVAYS